MTQLVRLYILAALVALGTSRPYQPHHFGSLDSAFHWTSCSDTLLRPRDTGDVAEIVSAAFREKEATGKDFLIRTSHQHFFSHNNLSCTYISEDTATYTLMLDLSHMDEVLSVDQEQQVVTVQSGITYEVLEEALLDLGLSLPGWITPPPYAGMSLAAALESGAQGSSLVGPASLAAYLQGAVLVDGTGTTHVLSSPSDLLLLEASLGLLGVVTELSLSVVSARKVSVSELVQEDVDMLEDVRRLIEESQAVSLDLIWSPAAGLYTARVWHEVDADEEGDAVHGAALFPRDWLDKVEGLLALDQEEQQGDGGEAGYDLMCEVVGDVTASPAFLQEELQLQRRQRQQQEAEAEAVAGGGGAGGALSAPVVGWVNRMASARCLFLGGQQEGQDAAAAAADADMCLWRQSKLTPHTLSIASGDLSRWLQDVRRVLSFTAECPSIMVHLRFVMASSALLSPAAGRQSVSIDVQSLSSLKYRQLLPVKHQDLLDEILQLSLCKYDARPHWALATNRMLVNGCGLHRAYADNLQQFQQHMQRYDPQELFLHPLFISIAMQAGPQLYPGCALTEDCFCEEDEHCGPGFRCVPGNVYPDYKVCRMWGRENVGGADEL